MTQAAPSAPTNLQVALDLGVSEAAASRYRSGARHPRFTVQEAIARKYGWPVSDQASAHSRGEWAQEFEKALCRPSSVS